MSLPSLRVVFASVVLSSLYVPLSSSVFLFLGDEVYFFFFFIIFILFICYLLFVFVYAGLNWFGTWCERDGNFGKENEMKETENEMK